MDVSLIVNWLGRQGGDVLRWWLLVTLAGVAAWPLLFRVMGGLPDRGYTLARTAGVMLVGFIFWFLGSLGLLQNRPGGAAFAWAVVLAIGLVAFFRWEDRPPLRPWLREHRALIILTEVLFLVLLFGWAAFRALNPEIDSTEKPMEIMFLNSIRSSAAFPPHDAWLSGYAISYYYFGYVIMATLADLAGMSSGIAFGLMIALLFALAGIGALGVVYNLVRAQGRQAGVTAALAAGVLGMCFLILMGNLGVALVELPYRGYTPGLVNASYFDFWDVAEREGEVQVQVDQEGVAQYAPVDSNHDGIPDWNDKAQSPDNWGYWWWFRYSRVVQDRHLDGQPEPVQPIAEFPNFSFVLADLHPHVLALPFAVLAIGLALNLVLGGRELRHWEYPLYAIWVGGMVFMNSWDAIYLPLLVGAEALRRLIRNGNGVLHLEDLAGIVRFALIVGGLTLVFYLPWIVSFTSQASGILPNVIYPTPWQQFFLQFGIFLVILAVFLIVEIRRAGWRFYWQAGLLAVTAIVAVAVVSTTIMGIAAWDSAAVRYPVYSVSGAANGLRGLLPDILSRRLIGLPSELLLLGFVLVVVGRLFARPAVYPAADDAPVRAQGTINYSPATGFALLLVGAAALLTFAPDFVYLHDNFGVRINTVFKLYYQGWIMFSLVGAFAVWSVLAREPGAERKLKRQRSIVGLAGRIAFGAVVVVLFAAGMLYPALAPRSRALVETGRLALQRQVAACDAEAVGGEGCPELPPLTLNGAPTMISADEYAAVQCLSGLEGNRKDSQAVLIEAPCRNCGYHPEIGRFSALTGIPTLLGWGNHEGQWRGTSLPELLDTRIENGQRRDRVTDAQDLYTTQDWQVVWQVIDRYGIDYIVVGNAERQMIQDLAADNETLLRQYQAGLQKFDQVLTPVCQAGSAVVYRVKPE
jgi:YYY domain-containing protein